jgi:5-deoxy-glucuronate isomerase
MLMDFGALRLGPGESYSSETGDERAFLLSSGEVLFSWPGGSAKASRLSLFDEAPSVLHLPAGARAGIEAGPKGAELYLLATANEASFEPRFYRPSDCRDEERGKGTMGETSTRIVRTVFDDSNAPRAKLVLGEVITCPGKWSSYPPHHHPQPEIYHYRFLPERGFGLTAIGEEAYLLRDRDTVLIEGGKDHPQTSAPGYAMWYLWAIRHLDADRYRAPWPETTKEHAWVTAPNARIWAPSHNARSGEKE